MSKLVLPTRSEAEPETDGAEPWRNIPSPRAPLAAGLVVAVSAVLTALGIMLYLQNRTTPGASQFFDPVAPALALTAPSVGLVVASRRSSNPVAWLLCGSGLAGVAFFAEQYAVYALVGHPGSLPAGTWMAWLGSWTWMPGILPLTTLLLLLFPEGQLPSPRWRPLALAVVGAGTLAVASAALAPESAGSPAPVNPAGISALPQLSGLVQATTGACSLVLAPLCLAGLLSRYRHAVTERRIQLRWFLGAAVLAVGAPFAGIFLPLRLYQAMGLFGLVGLAAGIGVGAVRYRLYEIDRREIDLLTSRAVAYGGMAATSASIYWITVRVLHVGFGVTRRFGAPIVAVLAIAVTWRPLLALVSDLVDRLRSPRRAYQALISLGHCLESSIVPDDVLPALAGTIAAALELPYVAVEVGRGQEITAAAVHGEPRSEVTVVPLVHHHEVVGRLTVAPGAGGRLDATDVRLLRDLASQAGSAAYSVRLTANLRLSKERLVTAREEEWRHVRRELHDRLGPLDGILLGIGAVSNTLDRADSPGAKALLARLKTDLRSEVADIRALVDRLRPRSLDELGLVGALERKAALSALPPRPLVVSVEAADLGVVPAAVEVAAYQIASEALTNVQRHALARGCKIRLAVNEGWLELEVSDDGVGLAPGHREGVGLRGMRERASELGGSFSVAAGHGGGNRVCVEIPVGDPMSEHRSAAEERSSRQPQRPRSGGRPPEAATP